MGEDPERCTPADHAAAVELDGHGFLVEYGDDEFTIYGDDGKPLATTPHQWLITAILACCAQHTPRST